VPDRRAIDWCIGAEVEAAADEGQPYSGEEECHLRITVHHCCITGLPIFWCKLRLCYLVMTATVIWTALVLLIAFITSYPVRGVNTVKYCDEYVCLSECVKRVCPMRNWLCMIWSCRWYEVVIVCGRWSSSDGIAIYYVLPVVQITSFFRRRSVGDDNSWTLEWGRQWGEVCYLWLFVKQPFLSDGRSAPEKLLLYCYYYYVNLMMLWISNGMIR